jgi:hypothetical protein
MVGDGRRGEFHAQLNAHNVRLRKEKEMCPKPGVEHTTSRGDFSPRVFNAVGVTGALSLRATVGRGLADSRRCANRLRINAVKPEKNGA